MRPLRILRLEVQRSERTLLQRSLRGPAVKLQRRIGLLDSRQCDDESLVMQLNEQRAKIRLARQRPVGGQHVNIETFEHAGKAFANCQVSLCTLLFIQHRSARAQSDSRRDSIRCIDWCACYLR